ncbi:hypothetical protein Moror_5439 [Moniliophthora roreri MCA 2997]|uniref:Uncharacterized protein n=1 Tax=Moniliophthora roreri (strain MCA 2997) TaxID=1381753 RepID=V2W564_MONRO|nr:hypothetical protein Moror_5439 [Moniliophthora roreri MCA 2997]
MKFTVTLTSLLLAATSVFTQTEDPYADYGVISPAAGTTISVNTPLNVTFNPHRYARESTNNIDIFLISGAETSEPKSVVWSGISTPAYQVDIDLTQLAAPVPGERTVLIQERFNGFGGGNSLAFWSQTFSVTE